MMRTALSDSLGATHPPASQDPSQEGRPPLPPSPPGRGGPKSLPRTRCGGRGGFRLASHIRRPADFFADRSALGTALAAAFFALIGLGGIALVGDHVYLTYQRDLLKIAADAAGLAAAYRLPTFGSDVSDEAVKTALKPVVRRYILANVPEAKRQQAQDTLELTLTPDRAAGTVSVEAKADLGGIVFGRWLYGDVAGKTQVKSGTERITGITEVALAIDVTGSMVYTPAGVYSPRGSDNRMETVKRAALNLVNTLTADGSGQTAIGLVPWNYLVRLDATARTRWEDQGWVSYPTQRTYPNPYKDAPSGGETHTLPARNGASWWGCVDQRSLCTAGNNADPWDGCLPQHRTAGTSPPGLSLALPSDEPFTMLFYPARTLTPTSTISYQCRADKVQKSCYDESSVPPEDRPDQRNLQSGEYYLEKPQHGCWSGGSEILPLTTDTGTIKGAIQALGIQGSATYSAPGIVWAHRLLAHEWRSVWGANRTHPVNPTEHTDAQKALVLLTDGEDNHVREAEEHRQHACQAAKDDGITVFTIAAMKTDGGYAAFKEALKDCASKPEYAFVNNATPEALEDTFQQIAAQLARFRRVM